jgi:hypothetical protein
VAQWIVVPPQRTFDELTAAGTFTPVIEVTFEVQPSGTQGTIKVPRRDYTPELIRQLIDAEATKIAAVDALSSNS